MHSRTNSQATKSIVFYQLLLNSESNPEPNPEPHNYQKAHNLHVQGHQFINIQLRNVASGDIDAKITTASRKKLTLLVWSLHSQHYIHRNKYSSAVMLYFFFKLEFQAYTTAVIQCLNIQSRSSNQ